MLITELNLKRTQPRLNSLKKVESKTDEPLFYTSTTVKPKGQKSNSVNSNRHNKKLDKK